MQESWAILLFETNMFIFKYSWQKDNTAYHSSF